MSYVTPGLILTVKSERGYHEEEIFDLFLGNGWALVNEKKVVGESDSYIYYTFKAGQLAKMPFVKLARAKIIKLY